MLLSELFNYWNYGELSQLALGNATPEGIPETSYPALLSHLNLGLIELHKEFSLKEREVVIQMYSDITLYKLTEEFSDTLGTAPVKYILDSVDEPFTDQVLKIRKVVSSNPKVQLIWNDKTEVDNPITQYAYNTIRIGKPDPAHTVTVHYRAAPDPVTLPAVDPDPATVEIPIPLSLAEALGYFVAARVHSNTPAMEHTQSEGAIYMQKYQLSIMKLKETGLAEDFHLPNTRLDDNGWV